MWGDKVRMFLILVILLLISTYVGGALLRGQSRNTFIEIDEPRDCPMDIMVRLYPQKGSALTDAVINRSGYPIKLSIVARKEFDLPAENPSENDLAAFMSGCELNIYSSNPMDKSHALVKQVANVERFGSKRLHYVYSPIQDLGISGLEDIRKISSGETTFLYVEDGISRVDSGTFVVDISGDKDFLSNNLDLPREDIIVSSIGPVVTPEHRDMFNRTVTFISPGYERFIDLYLTILGVIIGVFTTLVTQKVANLVGSNKKAVSAG